MQSCIVKLTNLKNQKFLKKMLAIVKPYWIKEGLISEEQLKVFDEFSKILGVFDLKALENTLYAFSHEQISRYPQTIDGKNSIDWYSEKKDEVFKLIQSIKDTCNKIKSEI